MTIKNSAIGKFTDEIPMAEFLCLHPLVEDEKDDVRLDDGTVNIDVLDAMEYAFASFIPKISNSFNKMPAKELCAFSGGSGEEKFL